MTVNVKSSKLAAGVITNFAMGGELDVSELKSFDSKEVRH